MSPPRPPPTPLHPNRYHCHILEHEDFDMMRFFQVMPTTKQMAADPALAAEVAEFDAMTRAHTGHRGHRQASGNHAHHAHGAGGGDPRRFGG